MNRNSTSTNIISAQIQNWENFCDYHAIGNWHGNYTKYNLKGETIDSFKGVRSLVLNSDLSKVNYQNYYYTSDGKIQIEADGCYTKNALKGLYLDNSFSCGSTDIKLELTFSFEIGFIHKNRRNSASGIYDRDGNLESILINTEHLDKFAEEPFHRYGDKVNDWQGTLTMMTPDRVVSAAAAISWMPLENYNKDYLALNLNDNISVSLPRTIEEGKEFFIAVEWLVNSTLLQRGIRYFNTFQFIGFTLEIFTSKYLSRIYTMYKTAFR